MSIAPLRRPLAALVVALLVTASAAELTVEYRLKLAPDALDVYHISMTVRDAPGDVLEFSLPRWTPGTYQIRDFHRNLRNLVFRDGAGRGLPFGVEDGFFWNVKRLGDPVVVASWEVPTRGTEEYKSFLGVGLFLYLVRHKATPCELALELPPGWEIATGLPAIGAGRFRAADYDELIDSPFALGRLHTIEFPVRGVPHFAVLDVKPEFDEAALKDLLVRIVSCQGGLFGELPYEKYVFFYHLRGTGMGGGGLEHRNSTDITLPHAMLRRDPTAAGSVTSHEFFHLWNVKRIHSKVLGPFDYTGPCRTGSLWLSEGVTSYYGDLTLARAGVWKRQRWYDHLSREIGSLQSNEARKTMSVEKASWTVWDRNRGPSISYYTKGELLGLLLDLRIRDATNNARSLDDVMRHLNWWFAKKGIGFEEGDIERAVSTVAQRSFADFFARYVAGVEELPYKETLALAGLRFEDGEYEAVETGVRLSLSRLVRGLEDGRIGTVAPGTRPAEWGFRKGDRPVSILDAAVTEVEDFEKFLSPEKLQDRKVIPVAIERDGQGQTIEIPFRWQKKRRPRLTEDPAATPAAVALRESWLARCGDGARSRDG